MLLDNDAKAKPKFNWKRDCTPLVVISVLAAFVAVALAGSLIYNGGMDRHGFVFLGIIVLIGVSITSFGLDRLMVQNLNVVKVWLIEIVMILVAGLLLLL